MKRKTSAGILFFYVFAGLDVIGGIVWSLAANNPLLLLISIGGLLTFVVAGVFAALSDFIEEAADQTEHDDELQTITVYAAPPLILNKHIVDEPEDDPDSFTECA